jgi:crotonobetainyl-CoA:carnitine CoA-transferase CaiB-like acyl-CoA transferase
MTRAFEDLSVLELSTNQIGATVGQFFADYGADVVMVEPPGGSPLRLQAGFPFWARGKRSVELDLKAAADRTVVGDLARKADLLIETFRPGVTAKLGLGYEALSVDNPGLVYVSITGFGPDSPYAGVRSYEAVVQAKVGSLHQSSGMTGRPGPAFVGAPYCSSSVAQLAIHGALAALTERVRSQRGQQVQANMAQALGAHDTWNGMVAHVARQYPDAFQSAPPVDDEGVPTAGILFRLMTGISADGRWLQFSQTAQRLFEAFMRAVDLDWMFTDPEWNTAPEFEDRKRRREFWELLLTRIQAKTVEEWNKVFDADPDVWAEVFRHGPEVFEHPQLVHDGSVLEIVDPERGPVRQLARLVGVSDEPAMDPRPAPLRNQHGDEVVAGTRTSHVPVAESAGAAAASADFPLAGLVVVELGTQYAAPFGATLLTDLGARVIKIEQQDGDQIRWMTPFPDLSGVKVLQGKESFAVDITRPEGLAVVHDLVRRADVVLQSFRAGVARRRRLDADTLQELNPNLIYVSAPAYGETGPCGHRPAYAPTIGAACGMPWRNVGSSVEEGPGLSLDAVKMSSMRIRAGTLGPAHADGFSALGVGTALLLGIYIRAKGLGARHLNTSMLLTTAHAMADGIIDYEGRPETPTADRELFGMNALYRLYETESGWVVLAAPTEKEWAGLAAALLDVASLDTDRRFATEADRRAHDGELAEELARALRTRPADEWESYFLARDVACVSVTEEMCHDHLYTDEFGRASGYVADVVHPTFGDHPRLSPFLRFSRSATQTGVGCLLGEQTDAILAELGHTPAEIAALRESGVVS